MLAPLLDCSENLPFAVGGDLRMLFVHLKHEVFERCLWLSILLAWLRTAVNSAVNFTGWPLRHRLNNRRKLVHISQLLIFSNFEEGLLILVLK